MSSKTVKYWRKLTDTEREPFATSRRELFARMERLGLAWCFECKAVVEPDGKLDSQGLYSACPFCNTSLIY